MDRHTILPQQLGDAMVLDESGVSLFDRRLRVGRRPGGTRVWVAPDLGELPARAFRSFDHPVLTDDVATFEFFPALGLIGLMQYLEYGAQDISIPTEVAATIVGDVAQQLAHSGLPRPVAHPGAVLVGFDGITRTLLLEDPPAPSSAPIQSSPDPSPVAQDDGFDDGYLDDEEDCIGIMPIEVIFEFDRRAMAPEPGSDALFLSPEEADGRPPTAASTVWRLGSMLLHLLDRGTLVADTRLARLAALREGSLALQRSVHPHLRALIDNALSVDPASRPSSASAFGYHLRPFAGEHARAGEWLRARCHWTYTDQARHTSETEPTRGWRRPVPPEDPWIAVGDLEVMLRPVMQSEVDVALGLLTPRLRAGGPAVLLSHDQAERYASKSGARLPTSEEWTRVMQAVIDAGGDYGDLWEWTRDRHRDGFIVRGGPWRNISGTGRLRAARGLAILDHESWESKAAPDVGLRLVRDRT